MDMNARLEKLEKENRRIKKIGIVSVVLASVLIISGQASTNKVVTANEFRLVDATGKVRGFFSTNDEGLALLSLTDSSGKISASLGASTKGSTLLLKSIDDKTWTDLSASANKFGGLHLYGSAGEIHLAVDGDSPGPSLQVKDREGYLSVLGRSDLVVPTTGKKEQTPAASLILFDKDHKVIRSLP